jgi:hypothetical protein
MTRDPIAAMLADAYVARHCSAPPETALDMAARLGKEVRAAASERALTALRRGYEAHQSDIDLFGSDPALHLRYLDARDEALALFGGELRWQRQTDEQTPEGERT